MKKVIVIGGGASGIIAALKASKNHDVTILEKSNKIGKKLLITGNGRCNMWNAKLFEEYDLSNTYETDNFDVLNNIFSKRNEVYNYLTKELGIITRNKDGYIYPYSNTAESVRILLERLVINCNINIITNFNVTKIEKNNNNEYNVWNDNNEYFTGDYIIVSTGTSASTTEDATFNILSDIKVNPFMPALVPIKIDSPYLKDWAGVRANVKLSLNDLSEEGEIQFTEYGISGIVSFNLSSKVNHLGGFCDIYVDFVPDFTKDDLYNVLINKRYEDAFETILNYKLMYIIMHELNISKDTIINNENINLIIDSIKNFKLKTCGTLDTSRSQVLSGGISLNEISNNMELVKYPNVYVTGEALDINGICGGYNLASAFITGYIAGSDINDKS